jgi:hypothetical protein
MKTIFFIIIFVLSNQSALATTVNLKTVYTCKQDFDDASYSIGLTEDRDPNYFTAYVVRQSNEGGKHQLLIARKVSKDHSNGEGFFIDDEGRISLYIKAADFFQKVIWGNALISLTNGNEVFLEILKCSKDSEISFSTTKVFVH